jgi:hypothetical protein
MPPKLPPRRYWCGGSSSSLRNSPTAVSRPRCNGEVWELVAAPKGPPPMQISFPAVSFPQLSFIPPRTVASRDGDGHVQAGSIDEPRARFLVRHDSADCSILFTQF